MKIGRNDKCWCGSGKKFKQCHLPIEEKIAKHYHQGDEVPTRELLKTKEQIEGIRHAGKINTMVLDKIAEVIKEGMSTEELNKIAHEYTIELGGTPAPLNYHGFPKSICTSINEVVCHGIPSDDEVLKSGDIVKSINGQNINSWNEFTQKITQSKGQPLNLVVDRDNKSVNITVTPKKAEDGTYKVGVTCVRNKNIINSIKESFVTTGQMIVQMIIFLKQMITGTVPGGFSNSVAGPVVILSIVSGAAKTGIINLLYLGSIISLNLGIINLVPFPALDGGRLFLLLIEAIRGGKKINPDKEAMINMIGFCALMAFMVFITYSDITKLFKGIIKF